MAAAGSGRPSFQAVASRFRQVVEAAPGQFGHQGAAVAEVAIRRGGADPRGPCQLGEGKAAQPALADKAARRFDQRLAQVAVMVAVAGERHVKAAYIRRRGADSPQPMRSSPAMYGRSTAGTVIDPSGCW